MAWGGRDWVSQFIYGFPLIGHLSQNGVYDATNNPLPRAPSIESLFRIAEHRHREGSVRPATIEAETIWEDALVQRDLGWVDGLFDLAASGRLSIDHLSPVNIAFRAPVIQPGKVRA